MKNFFKQFLVEDWVVTFLAIPLLIIAGLAGEFPAIKKVIAIPSTLATTDAWISVGVLFLIALVVLYIGNRLLSRPLKGLFWSFVVVFAVSLLAQYIAKIPAVKYYGFEAVFFSVIFGLIIRNCFHIPDWLKPAIQGEFFIKIGVVCLGATILIRDFLTSGAAGIVQACIVVTCVWLFGFWLSRRMKVEERAGMTMASGVTICGVSACIATGGVTKVQEKHLSYIISVVLIIAVPMIYLMPLLAKWIVPLLTDNVAVQNEIMGAWIGGTVDTTSGVAAASDMINDAANKTAMIEGYAECVDWCCGVLHRNLPRIEGWRWQVAPPIIEPCVGEVPEVRVGICACIAGIQPVAEQPDIPRLGGKEVGRNIYGKDLLDILLLVGIRLYRYGYTLEGYCFER